MICGICRRKWGEKSATRSYVPYVSGYQLIISTCHDVGRRARAEKHDKIDWVAFDYRTSPRRLGIVQYTCSVYYDR